MLSPELSEGTRLILCILTILHQEHPPAIILLEDIDRGMHPRLFEMVAPLIRDIAERNEINIIATTQNPYLVDCFRDHQDAVIIVEKNDGASTLTTLAKKMETLDYETIDPEDVPLGTLWYSGLVGGVPKRESKVGA
ncbi:MAG: AAA family ATPase [Chthoniobacterales bacterium]